MSDETRKRRPLAIDLFSGVGGLSLGLEQAGFDVVAAVDSDPIHVGTYARNFPNTAAVCQDIVSLTASDIIDSIQRRRTRGPLAPLEIDCVAGGPSCQGFSVIGRRDPGDVRNSLVFEFARLVAELRPKYFLMENVPGLISTAHRPTLDRLTRLFLASGYALGSSPWLLDARDFAIPQRRKRVFLLGAREGQPFPTRPSKLQEKWTVSDAIEDLAQLDSQSAGGYSVATMRDQSPAALLSVEVSAYAEALRVGRDGAFDRSAPRVFDPSLLSGCERTSHTAAVVSRFEVLAPGSRDRISRFDRLLGSAVSPTLRAGTGSDRGRHTSARPIHHTLPRVITTREAARLQAFPDWFRFHHTKWHAFRQIGNAIPPRLAAAVAREIILALDVDPPIPAALDLLDPDRSSSLDQVA